MTIEKIKSQKGLWVFIAPISGLILTDDIKNEIRIDKITFITAKKLSRVWKRLGLPVSTAALIKKSPYVYGNFFSSNDVFAVSTLGGIGLDREQDFLKLVRYEINILSLSHLGYGRRSGNYGISLSEENPRASRNFLMMNFKNTDAVLNDNLVGKYLPISLDKRWKMNAKKRFFDELIKVLRYDKNISDGWRKDILNAALLAGQSQSSVSLPQAFLWNMIAIETLLTRQGDSYSKILPKRVEAFIGWSSDWSIVGYEKKIRDIYDKRCAFVHAGRTDDLVIDNLLFSDQILVNVLFNILTHLSMFKDKESIIKFSEKVEAEHLLGIKSKIRPKTLHHIKIGLNSKDYESNYMY